MDNSNHITPFNGIFSCMEMAFASTNVPLLRDMASKGNAAAKIFINLRTRPERTFAVIQVGITLVGILSAAVGGAEVEDTILPFLQKFLNVSGTTAGILELHFSLFLLPFYRCHRRTGAESHCNPLS